MWRVKGCGQNQRAGTGYTYQENAGEPEKISLCPENDIPLMLDGSSAKLVWVAVVDSAGNVVTKAGHKLKFSVTEPGMIAGPKELGVRGGMAAVWIKGKSGTGNITLTVTGENLKAGTIVISTEKVGVW